MESADLDLAPNLESKIPLQTIFQTSKFMDTPSLFKQEPILPFLKGQRKNDTSLSSSLGSITLKSLNGSPIDPNSKKKTRPFFISRGISLEKSITSQDNERSSQKDIKKKEFDYLNENVSRQCKMQESNFTNVMKTMKNVRTAFAKFKSNVILWGHITDEKIDIVNDYSFVKDITDQSKDEICLISAHSRFSRVYYQWKIRITNSFIFHKICEFKSFLIEKVPTIEPDNKWKIFWDFFILFLYLCMFFVMGLQISFDLLILEQVFPENSGTQKFFQALINCVFFLDILIKCFTAYYQNGILVRHPQKILKNYISSHFLYDFLAIIPIFLESYRILFDDMTSDSTNMIIKLSQFLIYFKFFEFVKAIDILDDMLQLEERSEALFHLVKLIIEILLFSHFIACAWHAVAYYSPYKANMLEIEHFTHKQWFSQYLTFLFWTISWEKLEPQNDLEFGFGFFAVLASHAIFGFIIEGIHSILVSLGEKNADMKKDIRVINKFMDNKNIGYDLQMKIRKYFYFMHEHKTANAHLESEIIGKLSNSLKEEVLLKAYGEIVQSVPLFAQNFSPSTIQKVILSMKKLRFYPEEVIFKQDDISDQSLYLINDGEIKLFLENGDNGTNKRLNLLRNLKKGEFFGENSFFTGCKRLCKAVSESFSTVYVIERESFLRILSEKQADFEKYCEIRDKMMVYSDFNDLKTKCKVCQKMDHDIFNCPEIHYVPRREFILRRHFYSEPILQRKNFKRGRKRQNALKKMNLIQEKISNFDSITTRNDEYFNQMNTNEEMSENDFSENPDFPNLTLKQKSSLEENSPKPHDEEMEKLVNFEEEFALKEPSKMRKKETASTGDTITSTNWRAFKEKPIMNSLKTNGSLKFTSAIIQPGSKSWDNDFERMSIFQQYFVGDNANVVLKRYEIIMMKKKRVHTPTRKQMKRQKIKILSQASSSQKYRMSSFHNKKALTRKSMKFKDKEKWEVSVGDKSKDLLIPSNFEDNNKV